MHSQDIPREIVRVRREKEPYVHAFVTVPVWHNPRGDQGRLCRDHLTPSGEAQALRRSQRVVAALFTTAALAAVGFVVSCLMIPADAWIVVFPLGIVKALDFALGATLSIALSCLGAGARRWAHARMTRPSIRPHSEQRTDDGRLEPLRGFDQPVGPAFRERA